MKKMTDQKKTDHNINRPTITKTTDHEMRRIFVIATRPGQQEKWCVIMEGCTHCFLYIGPHADVTGLVGKCKLFMDVANKTTSMICFGLTRMFFLSGANYLGQRPLYP